jgi:hypothetical protein
MKDGRKEGRMGGRNYLGLVRKEGRKDGWKYLGLVRKE